MTLSEFKAWFEGFSEGIDKSPTEKQFAKIKAKVADIDGAPVTQTVYVDRYMRPWPYYQPLYWVNTAGGASSGMGSWPIAGAGGVGMNSASGSSYSLRGDEQISLTFDSHEAMRELGRAEVTN